MSANKGDKSYAKNYHHNTVYLIIVYMDHFFSNNIFFLHKSLRNHVIVIHLMSVSMTCVMWTNKYSQRLLLIPWL